LTASLREADITPACALNNFSNRRSLLWPKTGISRHILCPSASGTLLPVDLVSDYSQAVTVALPVKQKDF